MGKELDQQKKVDTLFQSSLRSFVFNGQQQQLQEQAENKLQIWTVGTQTGVHYRVAYAASPFFNPFATFAEAIKHFFGVRIRYSLIV